MLSVAVYFGLTPSPSLSPSDEDKALHDILVSEGEQAVAANDVDELRRVLARIFENCFSVGGGDKVVAAMASLMRG